MAKQFKQCKDAHEHKQDKENNLAGTASIAVPISYFTCNLTHCSEGSSQTSDRRVDETLHLSCSQENTVAETVREQGGLRQATTIEKNTQGITDNSHGVREQNTRRTKSY